MKKLLLLSISTVLLFSFRYSEKKPCTVEQSIETYYHAAALYYNATNAAERTAARNVTIGVQNPLDFNDPDFNAKVEAFLSTKLPGGCITGGAVCYIEFLRCGKSSVDQGFPIPVFCYDVYASCVSRYCGIPL